MLYAYSLEERLKLASLGHIAAGYFTTEVPTTITVAGTYYKVDATFTPTKENGFTWNGTLNRWDYSGPNTTVSVFAACIGSHDDAVESHVVEWAIHHNGVIVTAASSGATIDKSKSNSISILAPSVDVTSGDYIDVRATIEESGDIVYTENMNFVIR